MPEPVAFLSHPAFRAAAAAFVPELAVASPETWRLLIATVDVAVADRAARLRRQLGGFLRLLDLAARVRFAKPLHRLDLDIRIAFLRSFERAPVALLRRGVWGLRTLVFLGYYTQPTVIASLGYRASAAGWSR